MPPQGFSIGHSNHAISAFLRLLTLHEIELVADVRSTPYSRFSPQFRMAALRAALEAAGRGYVFLGKELGGRPEGDEFYDDEGHVRYRVRARSPEFLDGLGRLEAELARHRTAILCSEENPEHCHRRLLVGRVLGERGVAIGHIRGDGRLEPESALAATGCDARQGVLFGAGDDAWRSLHPVRAVRAVRAVRPKRSPRS